MRQAGEPSVEEILESIKKVIARDNRADAAEERMMRESAGMPATGDQPDGPEEEKHVLDLAADTEFDGESEFEMDELPEDDDDESMEPAPLVTENARISMQDSLTALAMLSAPGVPPQIVRSGETSLEGLTRDLLRPMLADWLEKNLPPIVERMVAAEIARIAGKRG